MNKKNTDELDIKYRIYYKNRALKRAHDYITYNIEYGHRIWETIEGEGEGEGAKLPKGFEESLAKLPLANINF
jgi:hypothetical protein